MSQLLYPTVLVAEDSCDTRCMLKRAFELKGYRVLEAVNGREALEIATKSSPNLILMDLNMPVLDGLEAVKKVRKFEGQATMYQSSPSLR